jgi:type IX secretion system PorP/SprF family membrane protein
MTEGMKTLLMGKGFLGIGRHLSILGFSLASVLSVRSQDPQFSQYFASPLTLNPASTGNFEQPARFAANFRSQWHGMGQPYMTGTVSIDGHLLKERNEGRGKFSGGLLGLYDQTAGGLYKANYLAASLAYHLILDEDFSSQLSLGFQASIAGKRLDPTRISFADQFNGTGFDLSRPSAQTVANTAIGYVDINTGLLYTKTWEAGSLYLGASAYHLTRPKESFLDNDASRLPRRYTAHLGGNLYIGGRGQLMSTYQFMRQGTFGMHLAGLAYGLHFGNEYKDIVVYLGGWYRFRDALIPYVGYSFNNFQLGLTYDLSVSEMNLSGTRSRSFEISLIYHFLEMSEYRRAVPWY